MNTKIELKSGDCLEILKKYPDNYFDLIYLDPPFFTQKEQKLSSKTGIKYSFKDLWKSNYEYTEFIGKRLIELNRVLSETGSIFFHCDKNASHIIRVLLDKTFGESNFQSEIIWFYKRWSNAKKGLLPQHQNILFYSKTDKFKFKPIYTNYSPTTNIDQILQKRIRDKRGKTVYHRDDTGLIVQSDEKKGVPLSDVWEIPYLNPKAKERVGYPTQKPLLLLERIIEICSDEEDKILDPFCGSGTTLLAANVMNRKAVGIDISEDALKLTELRIKEGIRTESHLLVKGKSSYNNHYDKLDKILCNLEYNPIQRNKGIDAILKKKINDKHVFIRIQRESESIDDAVLTMKKAVNSKGKSISVVIATNSKRNQFIKNEDGYYIIDSVSFAINKLLDSIEKESTNIRKIVSA